MDPSAPSHSERPKLSATSATASAAASTFGIPLPGHISSRLPGDLSILPLEILWLVFDQLLKDSPRLTHSSLCLFRKLALTNKEVAGHIDSYLQNGNHIENAVREVRWWTYSTAENTMNENNTPIYPITSEESDVITGAIRDDCPDCFIWLRKLTRELDGTGVNEYGWSFIAIAGHHASLKMLKYFFTMNPYHGPCIPLLSRPANIARLTMTTLRMITDQHNIDFLRALFNFLGPRIRELNPTSGKLTREEKYCLCTFVTSNFAEQIEKIGVTLYETQDVLPLNRNAYHAAVSNSIEFLDYLHAHSSLPINLPDNRGETPLHCAIRANRLDSVIWLNEHGAKQDCKGWSRLTAGHIAVRLTSEESERMMEAVLPAPAPGSEAFDSSACGTMVRTLMEGLRETIQREEVRTENNTQDCVAFKLMHEERAIRKCKLILSASTGYNFFSRFEDLEVNVRNFHRSGVQQFKQARDIAMSLGFERLAEAIQGTCDTESSQTFAPH
ncbi:hypothetical protein N7486_006154 [Penicillium sp. IBT 16267x]|nr:hypothetical protein N7486_006154 [Penicillium sp. IBT 16267x]